MQPEIRPVFVDGSRGRLFGLHFPTDGNPRGALLYLPPFAEEMNRCRALATAQAREFARMGYASLLLDPFGTGESDGELQDASWALWQADALLASKWLSRVSGCTVSLWGMRLGGLLAASLFENAPDDFERLLLWQPVSNGKQYLTQYLRLRVAWLMERGMPAETTESIRAATTAGSVIEVAGYPIAGELASGLDAARFPALDTPLAGKRIDWFENATSAEASLSIGAKQVVGRMAERGADIRPHVFTGPPLWQLHERDELPALIEATSHVFGDSM